MVSWEQITNGLDHGGYVAWETAVDAANGNQGRDHVPVFLELDPPAGMTLVQAIDATLTLPEIRLSRHERDLLATEKAQAAADPAIKVRAVAFWPRAGLSALPNFWKVLRIGSPLAIPSDQGGPGLDLCAIPGDLAASVPVVAVIDDGIGFLNTRFRQDRDHTRIRGLWVQAPERGAVSGDVLCGMVLDSDKINALLAAGGEEAMVYRHVNRSILPRTEGALTNRHAAHGTHVLDLAAGATPWAGDALGTVPIFAVQLPPAGIRETSGRRMEFYLLQGLRWILAEVLRQSHLTDVPPVVVNISLGSLGGPGNEQAFLAEWLTYEVERHRRMTKSQVRLVVAYGNSRTARLVARDELRLSEPMELLWRILPDDHTSSFLELRADQTQVAGLRLRLLPPRGSGLPELETPWPADGTGWQLAGPIAALTSADERSGQSLLVLAVGPTASEAAMPSAPVGAWCVQVQTTVAEPVRVIARVLRDDTPTGYRTLGRQSWLDHPQGWDWDDERRGYLAPRSDSDAPGCPVTREGTCIACAGAVGDEIVFVGSVRPEIGAPGKTRPAVYSAEGVHNPAWHGESRGPDLVAFGDDGVLLAGRRGAGVLSGATARMSGTSMAAPQVSRALLRYFLTVPSADRSPERERQFLMGNQVAGTPDPRTGVGLLSA